MNLNSLATYLFGEWLCRKVLEAVPHRHFVFSVPKILLRYFLYDRSLHSELSRCAWETLKEFFHEAFPEKDAVSRAIIAIHSFGDFLGFHPHLHILYTDGRFSGSGMLCLAPLFELKHLEDAAGRCRESIAENGGCCSLGILGSRFPRA